VVFGGESVGYGQGFPDGRGIVEYFADKTDLFLHVMAERFPPFLQRLDELAAEAGRGSVAGHLTEVATLAIEFYGRGIPTGSALFADPGLLDRHRSGLHESGAGPHRALESLTAYVRAERRLGRLARRTRPEAVAALLLGACFQRAFLRAFMGDDVLVGTDERFARDIVRTLLAGAAPGVAVRRRRPRARRGGGVQVNRRGSG
jgi:hypothetical protein